MSTFSNLQELYIYRTDIDLKGIGNSNLSYVWMLDSDVKNFDSLAECLALRNISLTDTIEQTNGYKVQISFINLQKTADIAINERTYIYD